MATLPTESELTSSSTTNAAQKINLAAIRNVIAGLIGTDTSDTAAARSLLGAVSLSGDTLTGAINAATPASLASAATVNIGAAASNIIIITGTTTITAFDTIAAGAIRLVKFAGALTLTYNSTSLILPGSASISTAAGDCAEFLSLGSGNWVCVSYSRATGYPISGFSASDKTKLDGIASGATAITLGTAVATTSGTSIDFTGIPSTAKRVTLHPNAVSTNGSSPIIVRGLTSGGAITSGYNSSGAAFVTSGVSTLSSTVGFLLSQVVGATVAVTGEIILQRKGGNVWGISTVNSFGSGGLSLGAGSVDLGADLTGIRFTTVNGTDTFDAGSLNISVE